MSVRRDTSSDAAADAAATYGAGTRAFALEGRGPSEAERADPVFMAGWIAAASDGAGALKALASTTREAAAIAANAGIVRKALEDIIPVLNLRKRSEERREGKECRL